MEPKQPRRLEKKPNIGRPPFRQAGHAESAQSRPRSRQAVHNVLKGVTAKYDLE